MSLIAGYQQLALEGKMAQQKALKDAAVAARALRYESRELFNNFVKFVQIDGACLLESVWQKPYRDPLVNKQS